MKPVLRRAAAVASCLLSLVGCGPVSESEALVPAVDTVTEPIWAQTPGAHDTAKQLTWDGVVGGVSGGYTLTSFAAPGAFGPAVTVNALFWDTGGCLRRVYETELEAIWWYDPTVIHCTPDPGLASAPVAVSWGFNRIDAFWFVHALFSGTAELRHAFWDGSIWRNESLGYTLAIPVAGSAPVVGSWGVGHLDVMYRDTDGQLRRREFDRAKKGVPGFDANGWATSEPVVMGPSGEVSLTEPAVNELQLIYRTSSGALARRFSTDNGATWTTEASRITIDGVPSATSWGSGRVDVVVSRTTSSGLRLKHIWREPGQGWKEASYASSRVFGQPRVAAALGRPQRLDIVQAASGSSNLYHSLYQESLPGFEELPNPQTQYWCFANAAGMVINYMSQPTPGAATCFYASAQFGVNCCVTPTPSSCLHGGSTGDLLDDFGLDWEDKRILTPTELRFELLLLHRPVIAHEDHNNDSGAHVVVIRDIYRVAGVDYVVVTDPADGGKSWVTSYDNFINYDINWHVDYMYQGIHLD